MILKKTAIASVFGLIIISPIAQAQQFSVTIENLTNGLHFTPLLVAAHDSSTQLFSTGTTASAALEAMAEGGDIDPLDAAIAGTTPTVIKNPASGLLAPGANTTAMLDTDNSAANQYLSIVAMILPSNDGFIGLDSWSIPTTAGTYTVMINAYDAGTEANDELQASIPQPTPAANTRTGGVGGIVATTDTAEKVHIHPGSIGDENDTGGSSDIDNRVHRWLNPVARITVTIN